MGIVNKMMARAVKHGLVPVFYRRRHVQSALDILRDYFELIPVTTPALADEAARLRYEVYCQERCYEISNHSPLQRETDMFDARSLQVLLRFKPDESSIGTVRLIRPLPQDETGLSYPTQSLCRDPVLQDKNFIARTCEVSRFCLSKNRRRALRHKMDPKLYAKVFPVLKVALIAGLIRTAQENGFDHLCGTMEPWLIDGLQKIGWHFNKLGPLVEFHGLRQPCEGSISMAVKGIKKEYPDMWAYITEMPAIWRAGERPVAATPAITQSLSNRHHFRHMAGALN